MRVPLGAKLVENGTELQMECPDCGRLKLHVNIYTRLGWCFYCGKRLSPRDVQWDLGVTFQDKQIIRPKDNKSVNKLPIAWTSSEATSYCRSRLGFAPKNLEVRYDITEKRLYFPIVSPSDEFYPSYHTRSIVDEKSGWRAMDNTHRQHYWYNVRDNKSIEAFQRIVIVEGIFDAIACRSTCAFAILGTKLSLTLLTEFLNARQILLWLDPDEAGRKASVEIGEMLNSYGADVTILEHEHEPGDCDCKDIMTMVRQWLNGQLGEFPD